MLAAFENFFIKILALFFPLQLNLSNPNTAIDGSILSINCCWGIIYSGQELRDISRGQFIDLIIIFTPKIAAEKCWGFPPSLARISIISENNSNNFHVVKANSLETVNQLMHRNACWMDGTRNYTNLTMAFSWDRMDVLYLLFDCHVLNGVMARYQTSRPGQLCIAMNCTLWTICCCGYCCQLEIISPFLCGALLLCYMSKSNAKVLPRRRGSIFFSLFLLLSRSLFLILCLVMWRLFVAYAYMYDLVCVRVRVFESGEFIARSEQNECI